MTADRKSNICADAETSVLIQRWDDLRRRAGEAHPARKKKKGKKKKQLSFVMRGSCHASNNHKRKGNIFPFTVVNV